jgi:hypothetical protein
MSPLVSNESIVESSCNCASYSDAYRTETIVNTRTLLFFMSLRYSITVFFLLKYICIKIYYSVYFEVINLD